MPTINKAVIKQKSVKYIHQASIDAHQYYNSTLWRNLRNSWIHEHPFCSECEEHGRTKEATEVHHVRPFLSGITDEERWELLTDRDNLRSLCSECHKEVHRVLNKNKK